MPRPFRKFQLISRQVGVRFARIAAAQRVCRRGRTLLDLFNQPVACQNRSTMTHLHSSVDVLPGISYTTARTRVCSGHVQDVTAARR